MFPVEGFGLFNQKHPGYRLVLVGDGPRMGAIQEQVRAAGLESKIVLAGESTDVHRFYAIADAFLLTSQREGFCIAGMEGLAFGLPLIATKVGGVVEYLKDGQNGYFISGFTAEATAEAMEKIVGADLATMSKNATESAQPYTSERAAAASVSVNVVMRESERTIPQDRTTAARVRPGVFLERLARYTGGAFLTYAPFEEGRLGHLLRQILTESHETYTLGFRPAALDGRVHRLEVSVSEAGTTVRAPMSYVARHQ